MAIGRPISLTPNIATKAISEVATADQTDFTVTGGYRINEIAVYRNGVRLAEGRDFTASDGSTVQLVTGATESDVIEFAVFDSFNVAGTIVSAASSQTVEGDLNITGRLYSGALVPNTFDVGIGTFQTSIHVGTALTADAAGNLNTVGVVTAASFSGDGSALVGLANTDYVVSVATTTGDLKVGAAVTVGGIVNIDATTDSTSTTTGALIVDGGLGVAKNVYIGAGLSVAGTLTYEDVTSVDSVGLITAKSGVNITGGQLTVGSGITMGIAGVATFSGTSDVHLHDNVRLNIGDASDLSIYHNGTHSYIEDSGTGRIVVKSSYFEVDNAAGNEAIIEGIEDGAVKLYYNGSQKLETTNDGTVTTGIATVNANVANILQLKGTHDAKLLLTGSVSPYLTFQEGNDTKAYLQWNASGYISIQNAEDGSRLRIKDDIDFSSDNGSSFDSVIHAGNVGSGGALSSKNVYVAKIIGDGSSLTGVGGDMDITSSLFV